MRAEVSQTKENKKADLIKFFHESFNDFFFLAFSYKQI